MALPAGLLEPLGKSHPVPSHGMWPVGGDKVKKIRFRIQPGFAPALAQDLAQPEHRNGKNTGEGLENVVNDLASVWLKQDAVLHMTFAVLKGACGMAQFSITRSSPGARQWMNAAWIMRVTMFNPGLRPRRMALPGMPQAVASQPDLFQREASSRQSQKSGWRQPARCRWAVACRWARACSR